MGGYGVSQKCKRGEFGQLGKQCEYFMMTMNKRLSKLISLRNDLNFGMGPPTAELSPHVHSVPHLLEKCSRSCQ